MAHVLLVDDYRPIRSALTRYLRLYGHNVTEASSVRSALENTHEGMDLVVTALSMPGRSGADLIRAMRDRGMTTPVIVMVGRFPAPEETVGAAFVLETPFDPMALLDAVDRVVSPTATDAAGGV